MILNSEDKINAFISKNTELHGFGFKKIKGGKNNKSFLLESNNGQRYFLKEYFTHKNDNRNRLKVEWAFLKFSEELDINSTPITIIKDEQLGLALYSFIEGKKIDSFEIKEEHIDQVLKFIVSLNNKTNYSIFPHKASDFNNSMHSFITSLDERVNNLNFIDDIDFELNVKLMKLREKINQLNKTDDAKSLIIEFAGLFEENHKLYMRQDINKDFQSRFNWDPKFDMNREFDKPLNIE